MLIRVSTRPSGIKKGVSTEKFYREGFGYKAENGPDIRDVVGKLELNARCGNDTLMLAALYRLFASYDLGDEHRMVLYDKDGKELMTYERSTKEAE